MKTQGKSRPVLITGGAGFVGTNLADRLLSERQPVLVFDNLLRAGAEKNLAWLQRKHGNRVDFQLGDVRNLACLRTAVRHASQVFHLAAQVAIPTSLEAPIEDFEVNARGTLNLLEALRERTTPPPLVFASTSHVYGALADIQIRLRGARCEPVCSALRKNGLNESRPLDCHSPHGCSKGAAEQYVLGYARTFRLPATVFRMSCIYGPHQCGDENQDWMTHFLLRTLTGSPITVYGNGKQVRDLLFVDDLIRALRLAPENMNTLSGQALNIGGGTENNASQLEAIDLIQTIHGSRPAVLPAARRPSDPLYYVSDMRKFHAATGWAPSTPLREGVRLLYDWLLQSRAREEETGGPAEILQRSRAIRTSMRKPVILPPFRVVPFKIPTTRRPTVRWKVESTKIPDNKIIQFP